MRPPMPKKAENHVPLRRMNKFPYERPEMPTQAFGKALKLKTALGTRKA